MENNNKNSGWKFFLGVAAGVAAGLYLNSDHGRKMRKVAGDKVNKWGQDVSDKARAGLENLSEKASTAIARSKESADKTRNNLKERIESIAHTTEGMVDRTEQAYEKAADWAVEKLEPRTNAKK